MFFLNNFCNLFFNHCIFNEKKNFSYVTYWWAMWSRQLKWTEHSRRYNVMQFSRVSFTLIFVFSNMLICRSRYKLLKKPLRQLVSWSFLWVEISLNNIRICVKKFWLYVTIVGSLAWQQLIMNAAYRCMDIP